MIVHDAGIRAAIEDGHIRVTPDVDDEQIQPASLDVRLEKDLILPPKTAATPYTLDRIELPNDLAALMTGRSSVARKKVIVHKTAGWIDPGFEGQIMLEMYNFGDDTVEFRAGERVAQLIFMELIGSSDGYDGQYQNQGRKP